jgi:tRNA threonylcarbamoyladenosine biosynthesis protein TsaB
MKILALYTAGEPASVALRTESDEAALELERGRQFERLTGTAGNLLRGAGCEPRALDGVAVARGPGSFTGLRSGAAMALGFARGAGVGIYAVGTLEIWAAQALADAEEGAVCHVVLDARRDELYQAAFKAGRGARGEKAAVLLEGPNVLPAGRALARVKGASLIVGDAREQLIQAGLDPRRMAFPGSDEPLALALARLVAGDPERYACDARGFALDYLRDPQAVLARAARAGMSRHVAREIELDAEA